ncbi:hypothetical protein SAMN04488556_4044 [Halostagnicola kamekurae]|uniref:Uncharacterized protein n=1 Tax=Halostagnicola kamekurae TaxID=619731 RepID=A0A1I6USH2_9EURY|nr:hypothetical protein SAMN04488556_4044 [Halostagnicola kamekurae]
MSELLISYVRSLRKRVTARLWLVVSAAIELVYRLANDVAQGFLTAIFRQSTLPISVLTETNFLPNIVNSIIGHIFVISVLYYFISRIFAGSKRVARIPISIFGTVIGFFIILYYGLNSPSDIPLSHPSVLPVALFFTLSIGYFSISKIRSEVSITPSSSVLFAGMTTLGAVLLGSIGRYSVIPELVLFGIIFFALFRGKDAKSIRGFEHTIQRLTRIDEYSTQEFATVGLISFALFSGSLGFLGVENLIPSTPESEIGLYRVLALWGTFAYFSSQTVASLALFWFWYGLLRGWLGGESHFKSVWPPRPRYYLISAMGLLYVRGVDFSLITCNNEELGYACDPPSYFLLLRLLPTGTQIRLRDILITQLMVYGVLFLLLTLLPIILRRKQQRTVSQRFVFSSYIIYSVLGVIVSYEYTNLIANPELAFHQFGILFVAVYTLLPLFTSKYLQYKTWKKALIIAFTLVGYSSLILILGPDIHYTPLIYIILIINGVFYVSCR